MHCCRARRVAGLARGADVSHTARLSILSPTWLHSCSDTIPVLYQASRRRSLPFRRPRATAELAEGAFAGVTVLDRRLRHLNTLVAR
jgi:hypothetical protein